MGNQWEVERYDPETRSWRLEFGGVHVGRAFATFRRLRAQDIPTRITWRPV